MFSFTRVSDPLIESYLTLATTTETPVITVATLTDQLLPFIESTTSQHWHQWSFLLKLLPKLIYSFDSDAVIADLQKGLDEADWIQVLMDTFVMLSHAIAVGLYPDHYAQSLSQVVSPALTTRLYSSQQPTTNNGFDSQFSFQSQHSINYDMDATLDIDNTQRIEDESTTKQAIPVPSGTAADDRPIPPAPSHTKRSLVLDNAIVAAEMMIYLIEKKNAKRIFEVRNNLKRQSGVLIEEEPWVQCQAKLEPNDQSIKRTLCLSASQNTHIQHAIQLVQRLTDRELERRMTVHMKYHELEDEGTARAMPSAGLMGLLYHLVQIKPSLSDEQTIQYLTKLQTIKVSREE